METLAQLTYSESKAIVNFINKLGFNDVRNYIQITASETGESFSSRLMDIYYSAMDLEVDLAIKRNTDE